ncbi:triple QxxK/R motif-containing protein [Patagioenas fasciata monilis]|uniref:Triple QxxK/R motif-containing protein n=1 Tax=Patagioenas fasciata monilis TaxID=372326 RepID=A0A1V4KGY2_PATFA|nr:triple QxxK/R motif-containing protein [Patagioenas fasciata monilis]
MKLRLYVQLSYLVTDEFMQTINAKFSLQWALDDDVKVANCFSFCMFRAFMIQHRKSPRRARKEEAELCRSARVIFGLKTMGRKDASTARTPVDQYRKQIGKQDYKKTRPMLRATRLKAEAKKTALGVKEVALVLAAILVFLLAFYAFFYLNISNEVDLDLDPDEN